MERNSHNLGAAGRSGAAHRSAAGKAGDKVMGVTGRRGEAGRLAPDRLAVQQLLQSLKQPSAEQQTGQPVQLTLPILLDRSAQPATAYEQATGVDTGGVRPMHMSASSSSADQGTRERTKGRRVKTGEQDRAGPVRLPKWSPLSMPSSAPAGFTTTQGSITRDVSVQTDGQAIIVDRGEEGGMGLEGMQGQNGGEQDMELITMLMQSMANRAGGTMPSILSSPLVSAGAMGVLSQGAGEGEQQGPVSLTGLVEVGMDMSLDELEDVLAQATGLAEEEQEGGVGTGDSTQEEQPQVRDTPTGWHAAAIETTQEEQIQADQARAVDRMDVPDEAREPLLGGVSTSTPDPSLPAYAYGHGAGGSQRSARRRTGGRSRRGELPTESSRRSASSETAGASGEEATSVDTVPDSSMWEGEGSPEAGYGYGQEAEPDPARMLAHDLTLTPSAVPITGGAPVPPLEANSLSSGAPQGTVALGFDTEDLDALPLGPGPASGAGAGLGGGGGGGVGRLRTHRSPAAMLSGARTMAAGVRPAGSALGSIPRPSAVPIGLQVSLAGEEHIPAGQSTSEAIGSGVAGSEAFPVQGVGQAGGLHSAEASLAAGPPPGAVAPQGVPMLSPPPPLPLPSAPVSPVGVAGAGVTAEGAARRQEGRRAPSQGEGERSPSLSSRPDVDTPLQARMQQL